MDFHHPAKPDHSVRNRIIGAFLLFFALCGGIFYGVHVLFAQKSDSEVPASNPGLVDSIKEWAFSGQRTIKGFKDDRVNILLLGVGGEGHEGAQLSDTMIIASIKPSTKQIVLLSVPRDLAVDVPGYGVRKINAANAYGEEKNPGKGGDLAATVVSSTFNIPIHYWVRVDFKAFEEIVDAQDGLTLTIERAFSDAQYPTNDFGYQTISFTPGKQVLTGARALQFIRSRHGNNGESNDFSRNRRQQLVLTALRTQLFGNGLPSTGTISSILGSLLKHTTSNLPITAIIGMLNEAPDLLNAPITYHVLSADPKEGLLREITNEYGYFLLPRDGDFTELKALEADIFSAQTATVAPLAPTSPNPSYDRRGTEPTPVKQAKVAVFNGTWQVGLAAKTKEVLEENHITITSIGNTIDRTSETTIIYKLNDSKASLDTLSHIIPFFKNAPIQTKPPFTPEKSIDILVVLGKDSGL